LLALLTCAPASAATAAEDVPVAPQRDLVRAANAPLSDILQLRVQDTYVPEFRDADGDGNTLAFGITMPLPKYRLIPFPQLSLLTIPADVRVPSGAEGFGDLRFVDVAVLDPGHRLLVGIGPTFVFPTANDRATGQGKWQVGPALAIAYSPARWLIGFLAQNPISFAGDSDRLDTNALFLQPFVTYQLGSGWFLRSQPQIAVDWQNHGHVVPIDLGFGRLFKIGRQNVNLFVEPFYTVSHDGPAPSWGITFGAALLYPGFWGGAITGSPAYPQS
jgi:hypothetical protein